MINSSEIKEIALSLGADKCGVSGIDRFGDAPEGFHPSDVWSGSKSVIVFLKRMPRKSIEAENYIVYSHAAGIIYSTLDHIGLELCNRLQLKGINAIPIPTDTPYLYWDEQNKHGMGILSLRHAAQNAGLGILGRNTLLINPDFGNMCYIGAILTDAVLEPDTLINEVVCPEGCTLCMDACPVEALDGKTVNQKLCREESCHTHPRGWELYVCNECRKGCPFSR